MERWSISNFCPEMIKRLIVLTFFRSCPSHSKAAGEIMPTTSAVRASAFTSITSSVSDAGISVSWVSPLGSISPSSAVDHIWASNANNNPGSDPNGGIQRHPFNERGHFSVNLVTPYSATPASTTTSNDDAGTGAGQQTTSPSTGSSRSGSGMRDLSNASVRIQLAHAVSFSEVEGERRCS